jgi:hypothetical protein
MVRSTTSALVPGSHSYESGASQPSSDGALTSSESSMPGSCASESMALARMPT